MKKTKNIKIKTPINTFKLIIDRMPASKKEVFDGIIEATAIDYHTLQAYYAGRRNDILVRLANPIMIYLNNQYKFNPDFRIITNEEWYIPVNTLRILPNKIEKYAKHG